MGRFYKYILSFSLLLVACVCQANESDKASALQQEQACQRAAAEYFDISYDILLAIREVEGAWQGARLNNKNKSIDHGIMGINSVWEKTLNEHGITLEQVADNNCMSIWVGAWILANYLHEAGAYSDSPDPEKYWRGIGYYNSHTKALNEKYALKVWQKLIARQTRENKQEKE